MQQSDFMIGIGKDNIVEIAVPLNVAVAETLLA